MLNLKNIAKALFGTSNERKLKPYLQRVQAINALEPELKALNEQELKNYSQKFRQQLAEGATLDSILEPAFAVAREAAFRTLGQRHYDVQLIAGMVLHEGKIAEMKTGEGKTLSATLPCYLRALTGKKVHVITVNDYLAKRDSEWMGKVHQYLGLTTGCILNDMDDSERKIAYEANITYGTNNEFGFDYLRDNMKYSIEDMNQKDHYFAIVDEVDSILIDEARTPLIISGETDDLSELYLTINKLIPHLNNEDYELDEKTRNATLTEVGNEHIETLLLKNNLIAEGSSIYNIENVTIVHHVVNALRAHKAFFKDRDYLIKNKQVVLVDEFTGRMMSGRRLSDGLHQALEAKENTKIESENQTLASITFQNYFRLYETLSGMTGTALTEQDEFMDIYNLDVLEIPTNTPIARHDHHDEIYRTEEEKITAIIQLTSTCQKRNQPVLVGTTSIQKSELLSQHFKKHKIKHNVLNARYHEKEAYIIAQAGVPSTVTIATNMAGRGTDIQLGGNLDMRLEHETQSNMSEEKIKTLSQSIKKDIEEKRHISLEAGGLCIIGTERHESRRIDNQLRGRSGRQGDQGESHFFLSLEDDLMRIFGTDRLDGMLQKIGLEEGEPITHPWVNKALERAQKRIEGHNFDMRKNVLKFDDVMNEQRKVIFEQRIDIMNQDNIQEMVEDMRHQLINDLIDLYIPNNSYVDQWDLDSIEKSIQEIFGHNLPLQEWAHSEGVGVEEFCQKLIDATNKIAKMRNDEFGESLMKDIEKTLMLQTLDQQWCEHLLTLEHLRQAVNLRSIGQRDPLAEYKLEAFNLFSNMLETLRFNVTKSIMNVQLEPMPIAEDRTNDNHTKKDTPKRNAPCICGSGKKYKHCCGQET